MSTRLKLFTGITSVAVVALSLTPASSQQPPSTREFFSPDATGFERFIDVKRKGPSNGDYFLMSHPLQDPADGTRVGKTYGICTILKLDPQHTNTVQSCEIQLDLADGSVMTQGTFSVALLEDGAPIAITGGTGSYSQAAGTLTLTGAQVEGESGVLLTLELG